MGPIAVTGATGFIGREAVRALLASGREVRACVRNPRALLREGIVLTDVVPLGPELDWRESVAGAAAVLHIAGSAHVDPAGDTAAEAGMRAMNVDATESLARAALAAGVARFVFVSSIGVHGIQTTGDAFKPGDVPAPVDFYARTKWEAEQRLRALCADGRMELVVVRPTLVAGGRAPGNLARLASMIRSGLPVPMVANGARRHLVGVKSLALLLLLACEHPAAAGRVLLAADDPALTTAEIAEGIAAGVGRRARQVRLPLALLRPLVALLGRSRDLTRISSSLIVDASETRAALGWRAPVTIHEELFAAGSAARSASSSRK